MTSRCLERRRSMLVCAMVGIALMAAADEIVFHQILSWHHFYDRPTSDLALMSDGLLHAGEIVLLVAGGFLFADLRRRDALAPRSGWAGLFLGLGGFQIWDGVVHHKLLGVHQIRYGVDLLPYDIAWIASGALLVGVGLVLTWWSRPEGTKQTDDATTT